MYTPHIVCITGWVIMLPGNIVTVYTYYINIL